MQKVAFHIGPLTVHWYGILVALGFLFGLWTASRRALRDKISPEAVYDAGVWLLVGAIVGARTLYVISYWREDFAGRPLTEIFKVQQGGLVFYGGLIGASLAFIAFVRRRKLALWPFADTLAPSIALGNALGRLGCLMTGCCYGRACDLPWAVRFPADHATHSTPVHPVQLYDSLLNFALYFALAWLHRRRQFPGQVFAAYLMSYAVLRSFVESFRGDYSAAHVHGGLTPAHLVSIAIFAAGCVLLWVLPRPPQPEAK